jgi:hypothetical protein
MRKYQLLLLSYYMLINKHNSRVALKITCSKVGEVVHACNLRLSKQIQVDHMFKVSQ